MIDWNEPFIFTSWLKEVWRFETVKTLKFKFKAGFFLSDQTVLNFNKPPSKVRSGCRNNSDLKYLINSLLFYSVVNVCYLPATVDVNGGIDVWTALKVCQESWCLVPESFIWQVKAQGHSLLPDQSLQLFPTCYRQGKAIGNKYPCHSTAHLIKT